MSSLVGNEGSLVQILFHLTLYGNCVKAMPRSILVTKPGSFAKRKKENWGSQMGHTKNKALKGWKATLEI